MQDLIICDDSKVDFSGWDFGFGELNPPIAKAVTRVVAEVFEEDPPSLTVRGWSYSGDDSMLTLNVILPLGPEYDSTFFQRDLKDAVLEAVKGDVGVEEAEDLIFMLKALVATAEADLDARKKLENWAPLPNEAPVGTNCKT